MTGPREREVEWDSGIAGLLHCLISNHECVTSAGIAHDELNSEPDALPGELAFSWT